MANTERSFFGRPSLGGTLSMVNLLFWLTFTVAFYAGAPTVIPHWVTYPTAIAFCIFALPIALPFMLPGTAHGTNTDALGAVAVFCFILTVNAFLWGHGLAWLLNWTKGIWKRRFL